MTETPPSTTAVWRGDIDSLAFHPDGHEGLCVIHRRAFRTLLGFLPEPQDCLAYFDAQRPAFQSAALEKIVRAKLSAGGNFHLNSRDIRLALNI